ncbi:DUF2243 domain-containing protein [Paenibacillus sp. P25]|nr:DUF2243 domain-containing protein [Paenibacillus sp. P25]
MRLERKNLFWGGFILGLGVLGALDGIVFHQWPQWHHLVDSPDHRLELISDGIFNLLVTVLMVWACVKIFDASRKDRLSRDPRLFWGAVLTGGGAFNLTEGLVNHQMLGLHHVKPGMHQFQYDMLFLLSGIVLIAAGYHLSSSGGGRAAGLAGGKRPDQGAL